MIKIMICLRKQNSLRMQETGKDSEIIVEKEGKVGIEAFNTK